MIAAYKWSNVTDAASTILEFAPLAFGPGGLFCLLFWCLFWDMLALL